MFLFLFLFFWTRRILPHGHLRYEEAGVRGLHVARGLLRLPRLRAAHRLQVLHPREGRALLRAVLRGQVCAALHALSQGWSPRGVSGVFCAVPFSETGRDSVTLEPTDRGLLIFSDPGQRRRDLPGRAVAQGVLCVQRL